MIEHGFCHGEAEDTVAQKFEPLVVGARGGRDRGVGERPDEEFGIGEMVAEAGFEILEIARQVHLGQCHGTDGRGCPVGWGIVAS